MVELLAPGGSVEGMEAALKSGADAVYIGGTKFGARAYALNPDSTDLQRAIDECHLHGRKLYLTVNTLLREDELFGELFDYLKPLYEHGLDAVLVQDTGVFSFIRENFPDLPIHASTQMSVSSVEGARLLKKMGAARIVPARELSLEEIREIQRNVDIEIECFIHGALCYCYSGQCLLSSMIGGRSGNRGRCAQPCRKPYVLTEDGRVESDPNRKYLLSLKDICTLPILPDLIDSGIASFKIEGRMKKPEYAAGVTAIYRKYMDLYAREGRDGYRVDPEDVRVLMDLFNRGGFSEGYYRAYNGADMMASGRPNNAGTQAARVLESTSPEGMMTRKVLRKAAEETHQKTGRARGKNEPYNRALLEALEDLYAGDILEVNGMEQKTGRRSELTLKENVKAGQKFRALIPGPGIDAGMLLVRTRCSRLLEKIDDRCRADLKKRIDGTFEASPAREMTLTVRCVYGDGREFTAKAVGPKAEEAREHPMACADIEKQLRKTGGTPFEFGKLAVRADGDLFIPVKELNELRREALEKLEKEILDSFRRETAGGMTAGARSGEEILPAAGLHLTASFETGEQFEALLENRDIEVFYEDCLSALDRGSADPGIPEKAHEAGRKIFLMLPPVWRRQHQNRFFEIYPPELLNEYDGFLLRNLEQLEDFDGASEESASKRFPQGKFLAAGSSLYTFNSAAVRFLGDHGAGCTTIPAELNFHQILRRGTAQSELIVYGYVPVMTTASCSIKNTVGCRRTAGNYSLTDVRGAAFPAQNHCGVCTNILYNSEPLNLMPCAEDVRKLAPESLRLSFTAESRKRTGWIAARAADIFLRGSSAGEADSFGTRGHFRRGVE